MIAFSTFLFFFFICVLAAVGLVIYAFTMGVFVGQQRMSKQQETFVKKTPEIEGEVTEPSESLTSTTSIETSEPDDDFKDIPSIVEILEKSEVET